MPGDAVRARQRLARERAGPQAPPTDLTTLLPVERALRLLHRLGNDLEGMLGTSLLPARAHELRVHHRSWPGIRIDSGGCDGTDSP